MINRQLYCYKMTSSRLKEFNYNINITFDEAKELNEIVGVADSQILRSIRDIRKRTIKYDKLEILFLIRDLLRMRVKQQSKKDKESDKQLLLNIQNKIYRTMFVMDYLSIKIEHPTHYDYIYNNGIVINGSTYKRFSCSAGQARVSTVILVNTEIIDELERRLNNGRDMAQKISPSKFNAYFGLSSSATYLVSEPKFIVIKDFENTATFMANCVTETDWNKDDEIEIKEITVPMNRTDGMGLVSYERALVWSKELGLDYVPSQFCIRQNFLKGMVCVFPIHEFCEQKNNGNYIVDTIYNDEDGNPIKADLRNYDVIITESQFKLYKGFKNIDEYINNCHKNKLCWGIARYSPKEDKDVLRLNYQFIQTLDLTQENVEKLSQMFVDWINGASYENYAYMLLFLLGVNNSKESIEKFLKSNRNHWIKSLIICPELKNDKYICKKIRDLIKNRIQKGCMGEIYVEGNFQVLVSDPYGFMQHACGQEVTGLLGCGEFYSNYWNRKNVKVVDAMRSPLTFVSEHVLLNLRNDEETNYWYRYCDSGIILNYHGHEVVNFAGADFDFDILASTSSDPIIEGVNIEELPVYYEAPKPLGVIPTKDDLYNADRFSFGSIIGSITNKSSNAYALLPNLEKMYGRDSEEYKLTYSRLMQCCKAQSSQIDKAKLGREVKGIPDVWVNFKKKNDEQADFYNSILLTKYPYFFKYRYKDCRNNYNKYIDENNITCNQRFGKSIGNLLSENLVTEQESEFVCNFYKYMPITMSDSSMNLLCRHIENINFDTNKKIKQAVGLKDVEFMKNSAIKHNDRIRNKVIKLTEKYLKGYSKLHSLNPQDDDIDSIDFLIDEYDKITENHFEITNYLIDYFYKDKINSSKDLLWSLFGKYIVKNIKRNLKINEVLFPLPCEDGLITYMGNKYKMMEVSVY